eukprot:gnl/Chilomastix_cuspidata/2272.p1 GENE.gnl/Chilomastix_cuspidata/2272~~gnl/Chilomastix_cuspidata/2272.p1  ORF type:complete len:531 (+),score=245.96 gnl/Chilomastix_cuspidata/2272:138-1730(+)
MSSVSKRSFLTLPHIPYQTSHMVSQSCSTTKNTQSRWAASSSVTSLMGSKHETRVPRLIDIHQTTYSQFQDSSSQFCPSGMRSEFAGASASTTNFIERIPERPVRQLHNISEISPTSNSDFGVPFSPHMPYLHSGSLAEIAPMCFHELDKELEQHIDEIWGFVEAHFEALGVALAPREVTGHVEATVLFQPDGCVPFNIEVTPGGEVAIFKGGVVVEPYRPLRPLTSSLAPFLKRTYRGPAHSGDQFFGLETEPSTSQLALSDALVFDHPHALDSSDSAPAEPLLDDILRVQRVFFVLSEQLADGVHFFSPKRHTRSAVFETLFKAGGDEPLSVTVALEPGRYRLLTKNGGLLERNAFDEFQLDTCRALETMLRAREHGVVNPHRLAVLPFALRSTPLPDTPKSTFVPSAVSKAQSPRPRARPTSRLQTSPPRAGQSAGGVNYAIQLKQIRRTILSVARAHRADVSIVKTRQDSGITLKISATEPRFSCAITVAADNYALYEQKKHVVSRLSLEGFLTSLRQYLAGKLQA